MRRTTSRLSAVARTIRPNLVRMMTSCSSVNSATDTIRIRIGSTPTERPAIVVLA
jgi:hypothetical protein